MTLFEDPTPAQKERALAYVAHAEVEAANIPDLPRQMAHRPIAQVSVIGAGTMGGGIAMAVANLGFPVSIIDSSADALARGLALIERNYALSVSRGRLSQEEMDTRLKRISGSEGLAALKDADLVIEAVPEILELKQRLFTEIDRIARPGAILATNTSGLDVGQIGSVTRRPADVVGAHFFAPANVMRLLEVVRTDDTAPDVVATLMDFGRRMGKVAVQARVSPGFIGNAMLVHYSRESLFLIEEGARPRQVDDVLLRFGFAMGKFAVGDMAGNDVGIDNVRKDRATRDSALRYPDIRVELCDNGRLGQKTGKGWYRYEAGDRTPHDDPELDALVSAYAARHHIEQRVISEEEILDRCLLGIINEGARLVEKKVALRPSDVDAVFVAGYGFPAWRGGPLYMADQIGLDRIVERIRAYQAPNRPWWELSPLLAGLAASGKGFSSLAPA